MLECKSPCSFIKHKNLLELIDTCWNVNTVDALSSDVTCTELIDTCWNVNVSSAWIALIIPGELIDTCWNVN